MQLWGAGRFYCAAEILPLLVPSEDHSFHLLGSRRCSQGSGRWLREEARGRFPQSCPSGCWGP